MLELLALQYAILLIFHPETSITHNLLTREHVNEVKKNPDTVFQRK